MIRILDITDKLWQDYVLTRQDYTIFHHPLWAQVIFETYGYQMFAMVNINDRDEIVAGLVLASIDSCLTGKRWVSMPFSDYCKMLGDDKRDLICLADGLIKEAKKRNIPYVEIRNEVLLTSFKPKQHTYYIHQVDLTCGPKKLYKKFHKSRVQANIKRANKNGVIVTRYSDKKSVEGFYKLHLLTRRKHGVPTQPKRYFLNLWKNLISQNLGFIMLVHCNGLLVNAALFLHCNNTLVYKYSASDPRYAHMRGGHALIWEAIQWGCQNGYRSLCLGRSDLDNPGLSMFKSGWGGTEQILKYSFYGGVETDYASGWKHRWLKKIISNSPSFIGLLLGKLLYKHIG